MESQLDIRFPKNALSFYSLFLPKKRLPNHYPSLHDLQLLTFAHQIGR
jgi:hypothetical protein